MPVENRSCRRTRRVCCSQILARVRHIAQLLCDIEMPQESSQTEGGNSATVFVRRFAKPRDIHQHVPSVSRIDVSLESGSPQIGTNPEDDGQGSGNGPRAFAFQVTNSTEQRTRKWWGSGLLISLMPGSRLPGEFNRPRWLPRWRDDTDLIRTTRTPNCHNPANISTTVWPRVCCWQCLPACRSPGRIRMCHRKFANGCKPCLQIWFRSRWGRMRMENRVPSIFNSL